MQYLETRFSRDGLHESHMRRVKLFVGFATVALAVSFEGGTIVGVGVFESRAPEAVNAVSVGASGLSEPASLILFGVGLWTIAAVRRRNDNTLV